MSLSFSYSFSSFIHTFMWLSFILSQPDISVNTGLRFLQFFPLFPLMAHLQFICLLLQVTFLRKASVVIAQFSPKCWLASKLF
jgi:hypothetical protein